MADMHCNRVVRPYGILVPDTLVYLINGKNSALIFHQQKQDIVFDGGHLHRFPIHGHLFGIVIDNQATCLVYCLALRIQAPQRSISAEI